MSAIGDVGLTALAIEAFAPEMAQLKTGRDFATWLGLVPKQPPSGGKERLGRMTNAGQADIRRLLIIGAMSRMNWLGQCILVQGRWLSRMLTRKPKMLVALANKMRAIFGPCLRRTMTTKIRRWREHDHRVVTSQRRCQGDLRRRRPGWANDLTDPDWESGTKHGAV